MRTKLFLSRKHAKHSYITKLFHNKFLMCNADKRCLLSLGTWSQLEMTLDFETVKQIGKCTSAMLIHNKLKKNLTCFLRNFSFAA